jgi:hypothetical protein
MSGGGGPYCGDMLEDARHASPPRTSRRIVWVVLAVVALCGAMAALTIVLLTGSHPATGGGRPLLTTGISTSAACASTNRAAVDSTQAGARTTLVPPGASAVLLCRYGPSGTRVLERSIIRPAIVSQLGRELNALPPGRGSYSCPADTGESITADFSYSSEGENPVSVGLSGCELASNGHVNRLGLDRPVIAQLSRLAPWLGTIRGRLRLCGGPPPGSCGTSSFGACSGSRCFSADQVGIQAAQGIDYRNVRVRDGRFTARVEPGRYRLVLYGDGHRVHGRVLGTLRVRVRLDHTTHAVFSISLP